MPTVPRYDNAQANQSAAPVVRFDAPALPNASGQQIQQFGHAMQQTGSDLTRVALDMQQEANQLRIDDGLNQLIRVRTDLAQEATQLKGRQALELASGKSLPDEYSERLQQTINGISDGLGNDAQRQAFKRAAGHVQQQLYGSLSSHMLDQHKVYKAENQQATLYTALDQAARMGSDNAAFSQSLVAIRNTVYAQTLDNGGNEQIADAKYREVSDSAWRGRYKAWQQEDAAAALANYQQHKNDIGVLTRDQIGDELFRAAEPQLAQMVKPLLASGKLSASSAATVAASEPRGIRNHNPGNIMKGDKPWQGEVQGADSRYASFSSPEAGIRAMGKNLLTYQNKYALNTLKGIISRWAPASENDTAAYIATVAKAVGVKPDAPIDLHDATTLGKLTRAMIQVENGKQPYSDAQISAGIQAALGNAPLPDAPASAATVKATSGQRATDGLTGIAVIDGLTPDQRLRVFHAAQTQANQDLSQLREALTAREQDARAEYLARGTASNPPSESEMIRAFGQTGGVRRYRELQDVAELGQNLQRVSLLSNEELARTLQETQPPAGEGFATRQRNHELLQRAATLAVQQRKEDPIAYALNNPAFGIAPLGNFSNTEAFSQSLAKRYHAMPRIAAQYGTPPAIMSKTEADAFGKYLGSLQAEDKAKFIGMVASATGADGVTALSVPLREKHPTLGVAAMLSAHQTTLGNSAALLYLQGLEAIEQKRAKIDETAEIGTKAEIYKQLDGVYASPQGRDAAAEAAYGIYAKLRADGRESIKRAVAIATGGVMEFNHGKIAKPYGWDDARFRDALAGPVADRVKAEGGEFIIGGVKVGADVLAKSLPASRLQTFGRGSYMVISGNGVVTRPDGKPYILKVAN